MTKMSILNKINDVLIVEKMSFKEEAVEYLCRIF